MSKEVKRFYIMPGSVPVLLSGDPAYTPMTNHLTDVHTVPLVLASDYDALLAERDALKKDAERYRYLRNEAWGCDKNKRDDMHVVLIGAGVLRSGLTELAEEALDTAIDAALQGAQP
jgi:hypothetical protein